MKYIVSNNHKLSKIGLGTSKFGTKLDVETSYQMLDKFIQCGGNVIDTARNYYEWEENGRGKSEQTIGKWLQKNKIRNKIYISTKGGVRNSGNTWNINLSKDNLLNELEESQAALQSDKIDIYLLHRDEPTRKIEEIVETMQKIAENGKVDFIGVCNWNIDRIIYANEYANKHNLIPFSIIQTWWSVAEYTDLMWNDVNTTHMDAKTYSYIIENDLIGMAYTSQAKGFFQKSLSNNEIVDDFLKKRIVTHSNLKKLEIIRELCIEKNVSPTAIVNGYITSNRAKGIALVSCSKMEQLENILENCDYNLDETFIRRLDEV